MRLLRWIPLGVVLLPAASFGVSFTLDFNTYITGSAWNPPSPVASLTIADNGLNSVLITLTHHDINAGANLKITNLWFGLDPFTTPTQSQQTPAGIFDQFEVIDPADPGHDGFGGIGEGYNFQLELRQSFFANSGVTSGMSASFVLTGNGIDALDFVRTPAHGTAGNIFAAIHLQGLDNGGSVKIGANGLGGGGGNTTPVPEPATLAMIGFTALAAYSGRRKAKQAG